MHFSSKSILLVQPQFPGKTDYDLQGVLIVADLNGTRSEKTSAEYKANSDSLPWIMILYILSPLLCGILKQENGPQR